MSCYSKEKPERNDYINICKSHSARSDRAELYRICPSKLSKRELEDLYFSLLENNLELKRTINGQQDKIRGLSTKVQRMTAAQRVLQAKEMKECCVGTKSVVSEQKESLTQLKRANQRMAERIRMLNMRLCSAKQFFNKSPLMSTSRCIRCANVSTPKKDAVSMRSAHTETRDLEKKNEELPCDENICKSLMEEMKLKIVNLQEELSHVHEEYSDRIGHLEAEVLEARKENIRASGERRVSEHELQHAAKRNSDLLSSLRTTEGRCAELSTQLSMEKRKVAQLETQVKAATISDRVNKTIEDHSTDKNGLKSATCDYLPPLEDEQIMTTSTYPISKFSSSKSKSSKTIPSKTMPTVNTNCKNVVCGCHFPEESELMSPSLTKDTKCVSCACPVWKDSEFVQSTPTKADSIEFPPNKDIKWQNCSRIIRGEGETYEASLIKTGICSTPKVADTRASPRAYHEEARMSKTSDDSGYMDANRSQETPDEAGLNKLNKELIKKILELQSQVDSMKIAGASELPGAKQYKLSENDRTSFSGLTSNTATSAAEKSGFISENQKRTDAAENFQPEVCMEKFRTSDIGPEKQFYDISENREINKPGVQPTRKLDTMKGTTIKAIGEATGKQKAAEERRLSKTNGQPTSNRQKAPNGHRSSDNSKLIPDKLEMPAADKRDPELELDRKTEFVPDKLNTTPTDQRAAEFDFSNGKLTINGYEGQNKAQLVPTKLTAPEIGGNRRESDMDATTSKLGTKGDRVQNKEEIFYDQPQVQVTEERKLLQNDERLPSDSANLPGNGKTPVTEDVPAKNESVKPTQERRLSHQDPTTSKEDYQYYPAYTYETESSPSYISKINPKNKGLGAKIVQPMKSDRHNSLQIPGPIPTTSNNDKEWKKNMFRHFSEKRKDSKTKDIPIKQKKRPSKENKKNKESANIRDKLKESYETTSGQINLPDVSVLHDDSRIKYDDESKDSINVNNKRSLNPVFDSGIEDSVALVHDVSMHNFYSRSDTGIPSMSMQLNNKVQGTQMEPNVDHEAFQKRSNDQKDQEQIVQTNNSVGTQAEVQEVREPNNQRHWYSTSEQGTYTVGSKQNRSTSPDNTDLEMSYMSDLPYEKYEKTLSPGEDKITTVYTDSYCSPATNYSLSEGEVPTISARKKSYNNDTEKANPAKPPQEIVSKQSMEAALQAISDELARCKILLAAQRPTESPLRVTTQSQTSMPDDSRTITLRRGVATQSIGDTYTPKCIFTLHIGTVVLSDEAVLSTRNKSMVLMWKFYDQNVAMTRMRAGRVVLFDFSTEYDIKITDNFLSYMKHEELPIIICELDKENEPFATCSLPLRDALLHTNRRADMSLALEAGPQMISARAQHGETADALDGRDEMGVIDLWCMLRADANMLPGINLAISQPPTSAPSKKRHHSRVMQQIMDDDHSNDDLDFTLKERNAAPIAVGEQNGKNIYRDVEFTRTSHHWSNSLKPPSIPAAKTEDVYDARKYPAVHSRSYSTALGTSAANPPAPAPRRATTDEPEHDSSSIIINEVKTKIKTPSDMKQALERSSFQSEFPRIPKSDEEITSQAHSSLGSSRSIFARLHLRGSPRYEQRRDSVQRSSMLQNVRGSKNTTETPLRIKDRDDTSEMEIYRKYENISKLIERLKPLEIASEAELSRLVKKLGSNRAESKKCVTIVPKYIEPVLDQPQRASQITSTKDTLNSRLHEEDQERNIQSLDITVLWLALNEECEAMVDPHVQRVYVAYNFLGRSGAELETPVSLPKPKHYVDKCYFNFKKTFELEDGDLPVLGHMARCRTGSKVSENEKDCIIFSVVSEPPEDPLGLECCEDIGYAFLYLGDLLAYSAGSSSYTEVIPVRAAGGAADVCGVLAVRLDGLDVVRRCLRL